MKKILVISPFFYPHIGGSERYMEDLYLNLLKRNPDIKIDVLCYNTNKASRKEEYKGLTIYRIPGFTVLQDQFCLPEPISLMKFLYQKRGSYDLIHVSTRFFDSAWWAYVYAKLNKIRVILTDHCAYHPTSKNKLVNTVVRLAEATIVRFSLNFYNEIFAQNKKTQKFLKDAFKVKSTLAYPGVDESLLKRAKKEHKGVNVVYVGRMLETKGIKELFQVAKEMKNVNFTFAGTGPLEKELRNRGDNEGLSNIRIAGGLSKEEVSNLLLESDILAYPSKHSEGLPMALIEAGASGVCVIATNSGAIDELIITGTTGILTPVGDLEVFKKGLKRLTLDKSLRLKLAAELKLFVAENFTWESSVNLILKELR